MTTTTPKRTVGQIAAALPASVRVFEKHGVDFCCGGAVPLIVACRCVGVDPAILL
jgi:regulator of cell morphogenesis and NO signaling